MERRLIDGQPDGKLMTMKLLLIEDTPALADLTRDALAKAGFAVDHAATLADACGFLATAPPDVIVLDLGLPDGDGRDFLRALRRGGASVPVLVVTARGGLNDRIEGLDGGADDYMVKPAAPAEIAARCRALLRRPGGLLDTRLTVGRLTLDSSARTVHVAQTPVPMARRDVAVLEVLMRRAGKVAPRQVIEDAVYGLDEAPGPNALEASLSRIRRILDGVAAGIAIHTVRGVGYLLADDLASAEAGTREHDR
jgi:two-component system OmpR family response regulator